MSTFHIIHIAVGAWLILSNLFRMFDITTLVWINSIVGGIVALYNIYFLFEKQNVDVKDNSWYYSRGLIKPLFIIFHSHKFL